MFALVKIVFAGTARHAIAGKTPCRLMPFDARSTWVLTS